MLVYLAGPIDEVSEEEAGSWRQLFKDEAPLNWSFYDPYGAFTVQGPTTKTTSRNVSAINRAVITYCNVVVVWLMHGLSMGSVREIEFATHNHKPVVVLVERPHIGVEWWDVMQVTSIRDAIEKVKNVA